MVYQGSLLMTITHGEAIMAKWLLKLQSVTTSPYVLLSNLYATDGMWDSVAEARLEVERLKKEKKLSFALSPGRFFSFTTQTSSYSLSCVIPIFFLDFSPTQISFHPLSYACNHMFCSQTYLICGDHMFCSQIS